MPTSGEVYLAIDLGAESGRAILGRFDLHRLRLEEVHRFPNGPVRVGDHLHWDVLHLWSEIQHGLHNAAERCGQGLSGIGLDTWGVDYGLLDEKDQLIGNPYHYRDARTEGMVEAGLQIVSRDRIYQRTGAQFFQLNSLYQLLSQKLTADPALSIAYSFLNIPDLFNFWLTGRKASEYTVASTTQCSDPRQRDWAYDLIKDFGLPAAIFQPMLQPGTIYGELRPSLARQVGIQPLLVAAIGSHDTASAVAAVPADHERVAFISSGTWSIVGAELDQPAITPASLELDFTNEGGVGGKTRFLKNISGLWLIQECRRCWAAEGQSYTYDELTALAEKAPAFRTLIHPNDPVFIAPGEMPRRIRQYAVDRRQPAPQEVGEFVRAGLEGLALTYRRVINEMEKALGYSMEAIHIVGGGSRNRLLNQFTADAVGLPVIAGPVEATAVGNILVQAVALGQLKSLEEIRAVVRASFQLEFFQPGLKDPWDAVYEPWQGLIH